jgi:hypothetical protein
MPYVLAGCVKSTFFAAYGISRMLHVSLETSWSVAELSIIADSYFAQQLMFFSQGGKNYQLEQASQGENPPAHSVQYYTQTTLDNNPVLSWELLCKQTTPLFSAGVS